MDLAAVQQEIVTWSPEDQDQLAAYLAVLRRKRDPVHSAELSRRRDDRKAGSWMRLDDLKAKLQEDPAT